MIKTGRISLRLKSPTHTMMPKASSNSKKENLLCNFKLFHLLFLLSTFLNPQTNHHGQLPPFSPLAPTVTPSFPSRPFPNLTVPWVRFSKLFASCSSDLTRNPNPHPLCHHRIWPPRLIATTQLLSDSLHHSFLLVVRYCGPHFRLVVYSTLSTSTLHCTVLCALHRLDWSEVWELEGPVI